MKIAIDISQTVYGTGVGRYTKELVRALLRLDRKNKYILFGASLRLFSEFKSIRYDLHEHQNAQFKLFPVPGRLLEILFNYFRIIPINLILGSVDLVHTSDWLEPPVSGQTKKITTVHDLSAFLFPASTHPRIVANQKKKLALVASESDAIVADSETTKEDLTKFLKIDPIKIKVVYLAVSNKFKPQDQDKTNEVLAKYKIKKPYILSVSTQQPRKNIQKLVDAFGKIGAYRTDLSLILVGKYGWGPKDNLDGDRIISTGYVPDEDLAALYSGCRAFIYPSLYEGFGLPILEAMACGAPTITSNNSSMVEIAKNAAILVDPRSENQIQKAIELVLDLKLEDYQKMVNASLNRARQYSWAKTAKQTLEIYKEIVGQNDQDPNSVKKQSEADTKTQSLKELS